jgi:hypothetical protein
MNMIMYRIQMAMGDIAGARTTYEHFRRTATDYWLTSADLITQAYGQPSSAKLPTFAAQDYPFLDISTNLYLVTTLVKSSQNKDSRADVQQALQAYLKHMPVFSVGLNTRSESIALMMAQRAAGKIEQAQQTASRLSKQLLRYRKNSPQSYYFWSLGSFQLISDFYCGQTCQPLTLTQLFEPSHRWWTDGYSIISAALEPWANEPLVKEYLSKVEKDRVRVRARLGM